MILPVFIILFVLYSILIVYYWLSWKSIPGFVFSPRKPQTMISIVIAARNEEGNIAHLLGSLEQQTYPKELFEVIVVDDHSTDTTAQVVRQFPGVKLVSLIDDYINSYKKKAIETGIGAATGSLIVTTDADCSCKPGWLDTIAAFYEEKKPVLIVAPVVIDCNNSVLKIFQALDFMVLQGITAAAVFKKKLSMCNGANLAYEKEVFNAVNGFDGIDQIASGDDMLLMHKIWKKYPDGVHYLHSRDVIIASQPMLTWKDFFNQRIRWASKTRFYSDKRIIAVLLLAYLFNSWFLVLGIAGFFNYQYWLYLAVGLIVKTAIEFPFFRSLCMFFDKTWAMKMFFFFQPLHILYTIVAGLFGQFGKYSWKGRKVR